MRVLDNAYANLDNQYTEKSVEDLYGNVYEGYIDLKRSFAYETYVKFLVDRKYSNFKGTFFLKSSYTGKAKLVVYADEKEIYDSGFINRETRAIDFDLSIKNAESIKVKVVTEGSMYPNAVLTNAKVYKTLE